MKSPEEIWNGLSTLAHSSCDTLPFSLALRSSTFPFLFYRKPLQGRLCASFLIRFPLPRGLGLCTLRSGDNTSNNPVDAMSVSDICSIRSAPARVAGGRDNAA